jgi:GT2 family glycosyltransferase
LLEDFSNNPKFGIIGKAGSCYFPESGVYWERIWTTMVGQVWHHPEGQKKWLNSYSAKLPILVPVVTIDGLFMAFDKNKIKHSFDESIGRFHFYDHSFCVPNYLDGVKIGVTSSFEITHQSVGKPNEEFYETKTKFVEKFKDILPLDLKPETPFYQSRKINTYKNIGKVAVIIPTKGKLEMLFNCIDSFYEFCNPKLFDIFIADTGSTKEELDNIKELVEKVDNIKLIEYDYYNFAKINNDVVKNHIGKEYEFLLFCNNDIKLSSDIINGMISVFKEKPKVGTVGCRLVYENNTTQHDGVIFGISDDYKVGVTHKHLNTYYPPTIEINKVGANTAGLMMVRKFTFDKLNGFNEKYTTCFEDVEFNAQCILLGLDNYCDSGMVAYHYESQTRKFDPNNNSGIRIDYINNLLPFITKNITTLVSRVKFVKK